MRLPIIQLSCRCFFFCAKHHITRVCQPPLQLRFGSLQLLVFPKAKIAFERVEISECDGHATPKLSQWRLTTDWLAPWESDCSRMRSKVSSDWLPSHIKVTRPALEIFRMAGYFPDSVRSLLHGVNKHFLHFSSYLNCHVVQEMSTDVRDWEFCENRGRQSNTY